MKFTLNWLYDHLETNSNLDEISKTLTDIGLEVESVIDKSKELEPFKVARVIKASKHPDADRLKVCEVETIDGKFQVVCGAPNAVTGMFGVFAPENSYIPGTDLKLKKSKIRGVESCGMLVSEKEMGISDEHEGIIEIEKKYKVGDSFSEIYGLNDPVIEINITPNRSDCLSVRGIARDLAAAGLGNLKKLELKKQQGTFESPIKWRRDFDKEKEHLCLGVSGRFFKNVNNGESPDWLRKRLIAIGLRPISKLVDITNYITFDLGRPLHVYDADKINGDLKMCLAKKGQKCKTLDEKQYDLDENMIVISDKKNLHGIGGVMGGLESGCSLNTKNVFLEVALFDPISVTKTGRKLNLHSDARYRFERGIDSTSIEWGVDKASEMILDLCGGELSKITTAQDSKQKQKNITFNFNRTKTLGGVEIDLKKQKEILNNLGFEVTADNNNLSNILVPFFRPDIVGSADIVEEILRIYGFDKIKAKSIFKEPKNDKQILNPKLKSFYKSKKLLATRGYFETVTWSFLSDNLANIGDVSENVKIKNPISNDLNNMRSSIFPNLLLSINPNIGRLFNTGKLFEVGPQFMGAKEDDQMMVATAIQYGIIGGENWSEESRNFDVFDIKSDLYFVLDQLNVPIDNLVHEDTNSNYFHPGKSSQLRIGKNILAKFGEIHPLILQKFEIKTKVNGLEIYLDNLDQFQIKKTTTKSSYKINTLQSIERDFAFLFSKEIKTIDVVTTIKKIDKNIIKKVIVFDVFEDKKLSESMKSIAFKLKLQPIDKTFTDQEIETLSSKIIETITKNFDGKLRQ